MASESKKPRVEEPQEDSSILINTDILDNDCDGIEKKELYKLPIDEKIDFTIKSHLTDATFVIEGKKIYAGSDFLSLLSQFFNALLKGNFAESNKKEIELEDIAYDEFHEMLRYLSDQTRVIKDEHIESQLLLGDRFDIKCLVDRAENSLIKSNAFSYSDKLVLARRCRLIKLETYCPDMENVLMSHRFRPLNTCDNLRAVELVEEPENGFIAMGKVSIKFSDHYERDVEVAGLLFKAINMMQYVDGHDHVKLCFLVNRDIKSSTEWSVEGFVEVKISKVSLQTCDEEYSVVSKFEFSLSNSNPAGGMIIPAETNEYGGYFSESFEMASVTIYVSKVSGVRRTPSFDFSAPSELTDAAFIVDGDKIHVNKQYLSTISPRFLRMFYDTNEVEVKNITRQELIDFLFWIYPSARRTIDAFTMFSVLKVAEELNFNVDRSVVIDYFYKPWYQRRSIVTDFAVRIIFHHEFNCGDPILLDDYLNHRATNYLRLYFTYDKIKHCPLYARMSPQKKAALDKFMSDKMLEEEQREDDEDDEY